MIRTLINPDGGKAKMPSWAVKYLEKKDLLDYILMIKRDRRHDAFFKMMKEIGKIDYSNVFYINKKGDVVFFWSSAKHRTEFLLMLS